MMKPLATIWILIYNNAKELEETVDSVCRQDYDAIEVILSDDCSREYDAELMERYAGKLRKRFADVRINHNEENLGTVAHINKVIGLSKGKYFISCCSGDRIRDRIPNGSGAGKGFGLPQGRCVSGRKKEDPSAVLAGSGA